MAKEEEIIHNHKALELSVVESSFFRERLHWASQLIFISFQLSAALHPHYYMQVSPFIYISSAFRSGYIWRTDKLSRIELTATYSPDFGV